jgi:rhodanese-related sulfurtransferase
MVGKNILSGVIEQIQWNELSGLDPEKFCLLDVRTNAERDKGYIPHSIHIPLPELRKRSSELSADKTVIVSCQSGQRSYYACRMLSQKGFSVKNLSGGYLTWKTAMEFQESRNR